MSAEYIHSSTFWLTMQQPSFLAYQYEENHHHSILPLNDKILNTMAECKCKCKHLKYNSTAYAF